ncbi:hypothetical protein QBC47DRAFT_12020 [Echria macrotheca]|uniref:Secreted protein n=1 Tax=Echria macrotheca TaxID=438768 RepID=A0AAJ0BM17_9PEZI|nr:hypothetical protein QBC47DRAFT_12020 [Echria macrotheca]
MLYFWRACTYMFVCLSVYHGVPVSPSTLLFLPQLCHRRPCFVYLDENDKKYRRNVLKRHCYHHVTVPPPAPLPAVTVVPSVRSVGPARSELR